MKYWFKNAIIYSLDVESFKDDSGDGIGDFKGLKERLEYLSGLGVNTIWLLPIFSTPNRDNGYDVSDYYTIDQRLGDMSSLVEFIDMAEDHNLRIIIDFPINHTSDQHPWFQEAINNPDSKYRDYYIWKKEKPENPDEKLIFKGQQESNWGHDKITDSYYYHSFYHFQPDLNFSNPNVRKEVRNIMHFWLRLGISGFRIDATPHIVRDKGGIVFENPQKILRILRQNVDEIRNDAVLLGESDVAPDEYKFFFGNGTQFHMLLNFYMANYMFLSFAKQDKKPIQYGLNQLPVPNMFEQYANFMRNHDELDLERLNQDELDLVLDKFAPEENMRIFGRGIRRRLSPLLNDRKLEELAYSVLFSLPGTPVIRYGDEIGMGDDLNLKGRKSVRTVMQWADRKNAGFSDAPEDQLVKPVIKDGKYGYSQVNVEDQQRDPESLLNWMEKLIRIRTKCIEFGRGNYNFIETGSDQVMAHSSKMDFEISIVLHNFSDQNQSVQLDLDNLGISELYEVFSDTLYEKHQKNKPIKLNGLGYRWFKGKLSNRCEYE
ncbi:MAG: alpha-amylase family protein [Candidatus Cyclobacteriaceae bacterium M3_2C_046]